MTLRSYASSFSGECREKEPHSARTLRKWADAYARERGLAPKRVRDWVSYMVSSGRLEQANAESEAATFTIKGAVAMEMRLPASGRAKKDIDIDVVAEADAEDERDLPEVLESALAQDYHDFAFRIKDDPYVMLNGSVRFQVAFEYRGRGRSTVQVDSPTGKATPRTSMLVDTPPALPCLSLRYHLARRSTG